jgi:hypothetical protein
VLATAGKFAIGGNAQSEHPAAMARGQCGR